MKLHFHRIAAIPILSLLFAAAAPAQSTCPPQRTISVNGSAEIKVAPDQAVLTLGSDSRDRDLKIARAENDARVKRVMAVAHSAGLEAKDIQTSALSLSPYY